MFQLPLFRRSPPAMAGRRVRLRAPETGDFAEWAALRKASRAFLEPWEPRWGAGEFDRSAWRERMRRYRSEHDRGTGYAFFVFETETGRLAGGISLGNIRHGVAKNANIGYWMGERFAGKGLMTEAIGLVAHFAFETLRLHRLEAACIPQNTRSIRVLEKAGFEREGLLRSYLKINGTWQDHLLYALIESDDRDNRSRG